MPPILYINLDRDTDRRDRMVAQFAELGLPAERLPGTLWSGLGEQRQQQLYSPALNRRQFHKPMVAGEKGCYASHIHAWQWLLDSAHPALVVLEDDVRLDERFAATLQAIETLAVPWDMIKLIGRADDATSWKRGRGLDLLPGHALVRYRRIPSLAAGYVLNRDAAQRMLARRMPFGRPVDVDMRHWWETGVRVHGVVPGVLELDQTSLNSSIGAKVEEAGVAAKWRKFRYKADYSWHNTWHGARLR